MVENRAHLHMNVFIPASYHFPEGTPHAFEKSMKHRYDVADNHGGDLLT